MLEAESNLGKIYIIEYKASKNLVCKGEEQCCGFGSVGAVCFWASWIRIRIHYYEVWIQILLPSSKIVRKTLIPTVFWLLYDFSSLKNDVNVASKSNKQKT
jgi:hypothetical protein